MNWFREITKKESQTKILKALKEENLTFKQLLKEAKISRSTLAIHLKELLKNGKIKRFYNTYQITKQSIIELMVDSWIKNLGKVAVHHIVRKKLNKPIEIDIFNEIEQHLKLEPEKDSLWSWKALFEYIEKEYPLEI